MFQIVLALLCYVFHFVFMLSNFCVYEHFLSYGSNWERMEDMWGRSTPQLLFVSPISCCISAAVQPAGNCQLASSSFLTFQCIIYSKHFESAFLKTDGPMISDVFMMQTKVSTLLFFMFPFQCSCCFFSNDSRCIGYIFAALLLLFHRWGVSWSVSKMPLGLCLQSLLLTFESCVMLYVRSCMPLYSFMFVSRSI